MFRGDFLHNNIYGKWFFWIFVVSAVLAEITVVYYGKTVFLMPDYIYCPALFFLCLGLLFVGYSLYRLVYRRWNNQRQILLRSVVGFVFVALAYSVFVPNVVVVDEKSASAQLINPQSVIEDFRSPEVDKIKLKLRGEDGKERFIKYDKNTINPKSFSRTGTYIAFVPDGENKAEFRFLTKKIQFSFLTIPLGESERRVRELQVILHLPKDSKNLVDRI